MTWDPRAPRESLPPVGRPGEVLREARMLAGVSQAQLAKRCGTAQSAVSRIERGQVSPTISTLERMLGAVGAELVLTIRPKREH